MKRAKQQPAPGLSLTGEDLATFHNRIATMAQFVSEAKVRVDAQGFMICMMDPSNVAMVHFWARPGAFSEWVHHPNATVDVRLDSLARALKPSKDSHARIEFSTGSLRVTLDGITTTTPTIESEGEPARLPTLEHKTVLRVEDVKLVKSFMAKAGDGSVSIEWDDGLTIRTPQEPGVDSLSCNPKATATKGATSSCKYSAAYLGKLFKSLAANALTIRTGTEYPLIVEAADDKQEFRFILAPRVDYEDREA